MNLTAIIAQWLKLSEIVLEPASGLSCLRLQFGSCSAYRRASEPESSAMLLYFPRIGNLE